MLGVAITVYSYAVISSLADRYLLPYIYSFPVSESVYSLDRFYAKVDFMDDVVVVIAGTLIALGVFFTSRYISRTTSKKHRLAAIVFATLVGAYGTFVVVGNLL